MPIYQRNGVWHIDYTDANGNRIRQSAKTKDKKQAQELHDKLKAESWRVAKLGDKPTYTWQQAVVRYTQEQREKKSLVTDLYHIKWLDSYLGNKSLTDINKTLIDYIKSEKLKTGASNATVNRVLATIKKILNAAYKEWEWLDHVPHFKMLTEPKERVRFLEHEEAERLLAELPEHLNAMVKFALATGLRESNITGLKWSNVNLLHKRAWIDANQSKNGKAFAVPFNDDAMAVLNQEFGKHPVYVFTYKGEPVLKINGKAWRKALIRAGIEDFRFHDCRHTWASWHVQNGTPLNVLKELGGWSDLDMVMRYAHLSDERIKQFAGNAVKQKMG